MTRITHRERSQNRRVIAVGLLCMALLIAVGGVSRADATPAAPAERTATSSINNAASTSKAAVNVPHTGYRFYDNYVCIRDASWGSFYPQVIQTITNQLDGPRDFDAVRFPAAPDICSNQVPNKQIIKFGLIPAANAHLYNWCAAGSGGYAGIPIGGKISYAEHIEIYWNFARAGCQNPDFIRRNLSRQFAYYAGLRNGNYGPAYTVMNDARDDILWQTANDLLEYNDIY